MGGYRISTTKIAEICGVSQGTVDRALNDRKGISAKTKEKILQVAREYGYRPNMHARSIAGGKSQLIGIVVFDLNNQYFSDLLTNIERYCAAMNYSTVVMFTNKEHEREIECIKSLYQMVVDGIVLCPINSGEEYEKFLLSLNTPIVTFGNRLNNIPYVGIDNAFAMRETAEYVIKKGYKKLIYVKPELKEKNTFAQTERLNAFVKACNQAGVDHAVTELSNAESQMDKNTKTAFICPTDIYAIRLLRTAEKYKAGIIGFDNIRLIDELELCLDSVSYDVELTAEVISDYIIKGEAISAPIKHKLVCRGSV